MSTRPIGDKGDKFSKIEPKVGKLGEHTVTKESGSVPKGIFSQNLMVGGEFKHKATPTLGKLSATAKKSDSTGRSRI